MLDTALAPYLLWAKTRRPAAIDLAGSNLLPCTIDDLPGAREAADIQAPNDNGYAPLVEAIAARYGVAPARVATAAGCSGANFVAIAALVAPGDRVLIEQPGYDPLVGACRLMGARVERFERRFEDGYRLDEDALRRALGTGARLVIVTTPHNPSGVRLSAGEVAALGRLAAGAGAEVLVDEVYLDFARLAADEPPASAARLDGPFVITNSLTKSYGLSGLRCGWVIAGAAAAERVRRTRDLVDNAASAPADRLGALAFARLPDLAARARAIALANLARARAFFAERPHFEVAERPAASVVFPRIREAADAEPFVASLLDRHGVAVVPGRFFDAPAHFRLGLAGDPGALEAGLARLDEAWRAFAAGTARGRG